MRALVTGADGFIGQSLLPRLRERGFHVRAATRRSARVANSDEAVCVGDLRQTPDWRSALTDVNVIFHLAAIAHANVGKGGPTLADVRCVNIDGTIRLAEAAAAAGIKRFVFVSTSKVMGTSSAEAPFEEGDEPAPRDVYASSKWEAEQRLLAIPGIETTIVRPPLVYGPCVRANVLRLLRICASGWPLPLAGATALRSICYVENLVDALALCAAHPGAAGATYFATDDVDISVRDLTVRLRAMMGYSPRLLRVPAALVGAASRLAGRHSAYQSLFCPLRASSERIRAQLGWRPPYSQQQGLEAMVEWFMRSHPRNL